jgi:hypothetical protein
MTAITLRAESEPVRRGSLALIWLVPATALWIAVNLAFPALGASGVPTVFSRVSIHVMIALGLWLGLERTELTPSQRRAVWLAIMIPFTLWLAIVWSAAIGGFFKPGGTIPVLPIAALGPVIVGAPILLYSKRVGEILDAMPDSWIIALQVFRVLGSAFLVGWVYHVVPGIFALPAGIGDVLTGLFAVPVAIALASGTRQSRQAAIAWNVFGLADFAIALSIGFAIAFHVIETGFASATGGLYPTVMIPAFGVPNGILLHVLSLRQLVRRGRA